MVVPRLISTAIFADSDSAHSTMVMICHSLVFLSAAHALEDAEAMLRERSTQALA